MNLHNDEIRKKCKILRLKLNILYYKENKEAMLCRCECHDGVNTVCVCIPNEAEMTQIWAYKMVRLNRNLQVSIITHDDFEKFLLKMGIEEIQL